jgi:hypothetical protein
MISLKSIMTLSYESCPKTSSLIELCRWNHVSESYLRLHVFKDLSELFSLNTVFAMHKLDTHPTLKLIITSRYDFDTNWWDVGTEFSNPVLWDGTTKVQLELAGAGSFPRLSKGISSRRTILFGNLGSKRNCLQRTTRKSALQTTMASTSRPRDYKNRGLLCMVPLFLF